VLFFHVGLQKTGTSFLQQTVFPKWNGISYIGANLEVLLRILCAHSQTNHADLKRGHIPHGKKASIQASILNFLKIGDSTTSLEKKYKKLQTKYAKLQKAHKILKAELSHYQMEGKPSENEQKNGFTPSPLEVFEAPKPKIAEGVVLERIRQRSAQINYDRIGTATADQKDDLTQIKGIGPLLEKRLNALGIYTLLQIRKFTPQEEETVNEAIEYFQGRITRDNWVEQAAALLDKQDLSS